MYQTPDYRSHLSLILSGILDDIGVNKRMIQKMRRVNMLEETISNISVWLTGDDTTKYYLGSQCEGTTTAGLNSDHDILFCIPDVSVIQDLSEWERGNTNYLMIQDENTTPGYCFLQLFRHDEPLPAIVIPDYNHIRDRRGRILRKNTKGAYNERTVTQHGPSLASQGQKGYCDKDRVFAFFCKSWPQSASGWLESQCIGIWPTQEIRKYAVSTGCCVVRTGSKVSVQPELEWRISTCLAERCLIFNLNVTQIRCYVLMKMILKCFLNPQGEINISSFMCKTVLLHTVKNTETSMWMESNLVTCLTYCMLELQRCVQNDQCPHFILQENNLMAGQFTAETKQQLLANISEFIKSDGKTLQRLDIDNLGLRLQVRLNVLPQRAFIFPSSLEMHEGLSAAHYINLAHQISIDYNDILKESHNTNIRTIKQYVVRLMTYSDKGNSFKLLAPFLFTLYGSALASTSIGVIGSISPEALVWLSAGLHSDNSSSKLKLASVFYSIGDMKKGELHLRQIEMHYNSYPVLPICSCWEQLPQAIPKEYGKICNEQSEDCIQHITAFCVRFIRQEINCVPHELQYEMFRSTQDDMIHRDQGLDYWMDWAVIDSLPFLYFLQYKIYGHLRKYQDQQQALSKLERTIKTDKNLKHKETALNILGQCMEHESKPQQALKYYTLSLQQRARNNVAIVHICRLLSGIFANKK